MSEIVIYTDFNKDVYTPEAMYAAKKDMFENNYASLKNKGQWAIPSDISEEDAKRCIGSKIRETQGKGLDALRRATKDRTYIVAYDDVCGGNCVHGLKITKNIYQPFHAAKADYVSHRWDFEFRATDRDGELTIEAADDAGEGAGKARALTPEGEALYDAWKNGEDTRFASKWDVLSEIYGSDEYSENPRVAEKLGLKENPDYTKKPDIKIPTGEENEKSLLAYRPSDKDVIAESAYEARLGLITDLPVDGVKKVMESDPEFKALFMGCNLSGTPGKNAADTMLKCAKYTVDNEESVVLFEASAWGENIPYETARKMSDEAHKIIDNYTSKLSKYRHREIGDINPSREK